MILPSMSVTPYSRASSAVINVSREFGRTGVLRPGGRSLVEARNIRQVALGQLGQRESLPQRNRGHVVWLQFDRHVARHPVDGGLAGAEDHAVGVGDAGVARNGDDQPGLLRHHDPGRMPRRHEVRAHAHVHHLPVRERLLPEGFGLRQVIGQREGVVDEDIQAPLLPFDLFEESRDLVVLAVVDLHRNAPAAALVALRGSLADGAG
jgi:hypothetical protein